MSNPIPHRLGEVGVVFRVTFVDQNGNAVSLAGATLLELRFESPRGVAKQLAAAIPAGGSLVNGIIEAATTAGFLDEIGSWKFQGHAVGSGWDFSTEIASFNVESNL
jgi:hypothetical protein